MNSKAESFSFGDLVSFPWDYNDLDLDFKEFFKDKNGLSVIDLGCGNGSQAYNLEKMGFDVTATDITNNLWYDLSNFIIDDALNSKLEKKYDVIIDRGLIHNLIVDKRYNNYFDMIDRISHDNTTILLKVLSPYEIRYSNFENPYRFNEEQLDRLYSQPKFKCLYIKDSYYYSNIEPYFRAYYCVYKKNLENS
tara:strand:- start:39 stop:617 length:579 start_codon:yes stop_codon:yes gene_type:complete